MINNNIQIHSKNKKSQTEIARATVTAAWGDGAGQVRRGGGPWGYRASPCESPSCCVRLC